MAFFIDALYLPLTKILGKTPIIPANIPEYTRGQQPSSKPLKADTAADTSIKPDISRRAKPTYFEITSILRFFIPKATSAENPAKLVIFSYSLMLRTLPDERTKLQSGTVSIYPALDNFKLIRK